MSWILYFSSNKIIPKIPEKVKFPQRDALHGTKLCHGTKKYLMEQNFYFIKLLYGTKITL